MKRTGTALVTGAALLALAATPVSASVKPKPLAYRYGSCAKDSACSFEAEVLPTQTKIQVQDSKTCLVGQEALSQAGETAIKNGRFKLKKTVEVEDVESYRKFPVTVSYSGTFKRGKSVKGTVTITTSDEDCAAYTGKAQSFSMKYDGAFYGG